MKKEIYIALDLEEPSKDSIIGVCETYDQAQMAINEYQSWKVYPSDSVLIQSHEILNLK